MTRSSLARRTVLGGLAALCLSVAFPRALGNAGKDRAEDGSQLVIVPIRRNTGGQLDQMPCGNRINKVVQAHRTEDSGVGFEWFSC